jgi:hypothetical protein
MLVNCMVLLCVLNCANGELFTSIGHLVTLVESIDGVTRTMEHYMVKEYEVFEKARK